MSIKAVSPDGNRVLVAPTLHFFSVGPMEPVGLSLVTRGQETRVLVPAPRIGDASFTPDGRSIIFETAEYGQFQDLNLARADGSGVRRLALRHSYLPSGRFALSGPWLYYTEESDVASSLYRVDPPGGAPELLADFRRAGEGSAALWGTTSPDGESVAYWFWSSLGRPADGYLQWAGSAAPLRLPATEDYRWWAIWAPDGSWLLIHPCVLVDMAGGVQTLCDASNWTAGMPALSPDGRFLATLARDSSGWNVHLITVPTGTDVVLASLGPIDEPWFRSAYAVAFTPDGSRVVAVVGYSSFSASIDGGPWTSISSNRGSHYPNEPVLPDISPDSRIIADRSVDGIVESIDGGPPHGIHSPDGSPVAALSFEPSGGQDKAIFWAGERTWLANADGTGDWLQLTSAAWCQWSARTAVCRVSHPDPLTMSSSDVYAVTDDGKQVVTLARNTISSAVIDRSLFYIHSTGGLYVVDGLPQPAP